MKAKHKAFVPASWYAVENKKIDKYIKVYGDEPAIVPGRGKHRG